MGLLYDIIMIIIVIMFCIIGAKRGIIRSIVFFVILIISLLAGYLVSGFIAEPVYDAYVKDKVVNSVKKPIEGFDIAEFVNEKFFVDKLGIKVSEGELNKALGSDGNLSENISSYARSRGIPISKDTVSKEIDIILKSDSVKNEAESLLPSYLKPIFDSVVSNDTDTLENVIQSLAKSDKAEAAEDITETILKPIVITVLRTILFILCFIAIWIILRIIVAITRLGKNSQKGGINTVLGGVLGIVKGLIIVLLITSVVSIISPAVSVLDADSSFTFSESTVNNSVFLRYINDIIN